MEDGNSQVILLARRTRTMKLCSSDARREGYPGYFLLEQERQNGLDLRRLLKKTIQQGRR